MGGKDRKKISAQLLQHSRWNQVPVLHKDIEHGILNTEKRINIHKKRKSFFTA